MFHSRDVAHAARESAPTVPCRKTGALPRVRTLTGRADPVVKVRTHARRQTRGPRRSPATPGPRAVGALCPGGSLRSRGGTGSEETPICLYRPLPLVVLRRVLYPLVDGEDGPLAGLIKGHQPSPRSEPRRSPRRPGPSARTPAVRTARSGRPGVAFRRSAAGSRSLPQRRERSDETTGLGTRSHSPPRKR